MTWIDCAFDSHKKNAKQMFLFCSKLDDESEPIDLSWPSGWKDRLVFIIRSPVIYLMYFTAQDIKRAVSDYNSNEIFSLEF